MSEKFEWPDCGHKTCRRNSNQVNHGYCRTCKAFKRMGTALAESMAECDRIKALYEEWGFADAPCPKHSKPSLLKVDCARCETDKLEIERDRLKIEVERVKKRGGFE